jgi:hypothetical protein
MPEFPQIPSPANILIPKQISLSFFQAEEKKCQKGKMMTSPFSSKVRLLNTAYPFLL